MNRDTRRSKVNNLPYVMQFIIELWSEIRIYRNLDNYNSSRCTARSQIYPDSISSFLPSSQLSRRKEGRATAISNLPAISTATLRQRNAEASMNACALVMV